jgi:copper chaperone CopZ
VENALNSLNGVWAEVNLTKKIAVVHMIDRISDDELKKAVSREGYKVVEIN